MDKIYRAYCHSAVSAPSRLVVVDIMAPSAQAVPAAVFGIAPSLLVSGVADVELSEPPLGVDYFNVAYGQMRATVTAEAKPCSTP